MNWRGRVLLCSFAVILSWGLVGEETTIGERLSRGMEESRKRSLVCPIQTPSILRNLQVARGEYAQWVSPQGVLHMKMVFWDASGEESVVFLKNGREFDRKVGLMPAGAFTAVLDSNL